MPRPRPAPRGRGSREGPRGGALVSGDAVYERGLVDTLPESDATAYLGTMDVLRKLDVDVVYPGHGWPFERARLVGIAEGYPRERGR